MTIEIRITADNASDARAQLSGLLGLYSAVAENPPGERVPLEPAPKARAPRAEKPAVTPPTDTSQKPSGTSTTATTADPDGGAPGASRSDDEPAVEDNQWDYQTQIKPAVLKVSQKLGRSGVVTLLEPFGVDNASKIPAERHGELMAAIDKMLEG